ncbi:MAG: HK97 family phage prohead protease [Micropepsaceae bacterium]
MATRPYNFELKEVNESTGVFHGYASTFDDTPDSYGDVIARGAFGASLKKHEQRGSRVALLLHHDVKAPVGVWHSISEDERGLKVAGRLVLEVEKAREALALMKQGALRGLSIGFQTIEAAALKDRSGRLLKKIDLWEISLVTFPANASARVLSVNARDIKTIREYEGLLLDGGFSRTQAKILAQAWKSLPAYDERDARSRAVELAEGLRAFAAVIDQSQERKDEKQRKHTAGKP